VWACVYVRVYAYVCVSTSIGARVRGCTRASVRICVCECMLTSGCACMPVCTCACVIMCVRLVVCNYGIQQKK
jgi:hypothetical protein